MNELQQLYQEIILDHARKPRNFGRMDVATVCQEANNPVCGDHLTLYLAVDDNKVQSASFEGNGCAISMASASIMTEEIKGKSIAEVMNLFNRFTQSVTAARNKSEALQDLGRLDALAGVRAFPIRIKCATLAWHALEHALGYGSKQSNHVVVTTEM